MPKPSENRINFNIDFGTIEPGHKSIILQQIEYFAEKFKYAMPEIDKSENALEVLKEINFSAVKETSNY